MNHPAAICRQSHPSVTNARSMLESSTLRVTQARTAVLDALLSERTALSHQQIHDKLPEMDRVTLYRALDSLTDAGLAHRITDDDRVYRYRINLYEPGSSTTEPLREMSANAAASLSATSHQHGHAHTHQHGHFKCEHCNRLFCIAPGAGTTDDSKEAFRLQQAVKDHIRLVLGPEFVPQQLELMVKGLCSQCADAFRHLDRSSQAT